MTLKTLEKEMLGWGPDRRLLGPHLFRLLFIRVKALRRLWSGVPVQRLFTGHTELRKGERWTTGAGVVVFSIARSNLYVGE